ncbi:Hemolysin-III-like protein [Ceratobasidium theobromae]|uniref:Hemolysin-III-like protein n=1 Tax=Ceratobasidium theobromae TaxID=1582974 RepID=A0A5N5Q8W7_9AGAM|nr:Hemolysin-III-like protein [Ceratobasidium theobromae]
MMWLYMSIAVTTGIAGSILPFQSWFDERKNKKWRVAFYLLCVCSALVPLGHMSYTHSFGRTWEFVLPVVPSLLSYLAGLAFYAAHFPECCFPGWFDWAGSHAAWHIFAIIAPGMRVAGKLELTWMDGVDSIMLEKDTFGYYARSGY